MKNPQPPKHLTRPTKAWWRSMQDAYRIADPSGLTLLTVAADALDRAESARLAIEAGGGPSVLDRFGQAKTHPACAVERDARAQIIHALKALGVDGAPEGIQR